MSELQKQEAIIKDHKVFRQKSQESELRITVLEAEIKKKNLSQGFESDELSKIRHQNNELMEKLCNSKQKVEDYESRLRISKHEIVHLEEQLEILRKNLVLRHDSAKVYEKDSVNSWKETEDQLKLENYKRQCQVLINLIF